MDNAVALVQAYLHMNGCFTVAEYPIVGSGWHGGYRTVTDLDILAFRFPGATRLVPRLHGGSNSGDREDSESAHAIGRIFDQTEKILAISEKFNQEFSTHVASEGNGHAKNNGAS